MEEFEGLKIPCGNPTKKFLEIGYSTGNRHACSDGGFAEDIGCVGVDCDECIFHMSNKPIFEKFIAQDFLKEGNSEVFKVGDRVTRENDTSVYEISYRAHPFNSIQDINSNYSDGGVHDEQLTLLDTATNKTTIKPTKEKTMKSSNVNKAVKAVYGSKDFTGDDMILVDEMYGEEIQTDVLSIEILRDKAKKILELAKKAKNDLEK